MDDDAFEQAELTPAQREAARRRAIRIFELIDEQNSDMLRLAQETISQGGFDYRRAIHAAPPKWLPTIPRPEVFDFTRTRASRLSSAPGAAAARRYATPNT